MQQETQSHPDSATRNADTAEAVPQSADVLLDHKEPGDAGCSPGSSPAPVEEETPASSVVSDEPESHPPMAPQPPYVGVVPVNQLTGEQPQWIICPFCQQQTLTRVVKEGTTMQTVGAVLCCLLCVLLTPLPYLCGWCEVLNYYCSACNGRLATRRDTHAPLAVLAPAATKQS
ncbi:hypothetical protein VTH06DRAFT_3984 [Thermothelomyces fergusii]